LQKPPYFERYYVT